MRIDIYEKDGPVDEHFHVDMERIPCIGEQLVRHRDHRLTTIMRVLDVTHVIEEREWYMKHPEFPRVFLTVKIEERK